METPKEKAENLIEKYLKLFSVDLENTISKHEAVECAKIAVEEIIEDYSSYRIKYWVTLEFALEMREYWDEVINELNKL